MAYFKFDSQLLLFFGSGLRAIVGHIVFNRARGDLHDAPDGVGGTFLSGWT